jgi:hypothetical protein
MRTLLGTDLIKILNGEEKYAVNCAIAAIGENPPFSIWRTFEHGQHLFDVRTEEPVPCVRTIFDALLHAANYRAH